ncbi:MAG: aminotransferase class I/II-fold pyridoxal phosphate-dependent enzyme [Candidatus Obscuribacterales bacterium]|nr:aminotransferase class I/II-fold pyridoxal phosphate-dependent enzyme [Candidatus Obscuribacterales bacterium]
MSQSLSLKPLSKTALEVPFSGIRRFFDIAASMQDVVSLGVGEPDFVTPWSIREAAIYSLERGQTTYTSNYGLLELRKEISRYLNKRYKVEYNPESEILVTVGVSEGLDLAMRVLLNPGDEVLIPEPCYVSYRPCVSLAGGVPVGVETHAEAQFAVTAEQLKAVCTERTKAILLGYPSNPTGAVLNREQIVDIINFARERGLYVVSDEIYDRLTYEGIHTCVASVPGAREITVLLNGFSKAHAMTGWRIAYACAPEPILKMMMKIHSYTMLCAPITGQIAAVEALKHAEREVEEMVAHYRQRRRLIVDGLNKIGLTCHMPLGAFYAFPSIKSTGLSAEQFAERLLLEEHVAVVPGTAFGAGGDGHIRCSYATSVEKLELALSRMGTFVENLRS